MKKMKVLMATWEKVFSSGLLKVLEDRPDIESIKVCHVGIEAISLAEEMKPDIVIIDEGIKDCGFIELSSRIRKLLPQTDIIIITADYPNRNIKAELRAKANAYIDKDITVGAFNATVDRLYEAHFFYTNPLSTVTAMAEQLFKEYTRWDSNTYDLSKDNKFGLSKRELDVLALASEGKSNKEIANMLFIAENTVKAHISAIFNKLNIHERKQIASLMEQKAIFF